MDKAEYDMKNYSSSESWGQYFIENNYFYCHLQVKLLFLDS